MINKVHGWMDGWMDGHMIIFAFVYHIPTAVVKMVRQLYTYVVDFIMVIRKINLNWCIFDLVSKSRICNNLFVLDTINIQIKPPKRAIFFTLEYPLFKTSLFFNFTYNLSIIVVYNIGVRTHPGIFYFNIAPGIHF